MYTPFKGEENKESQVRTTKDGTVTERLERTTRKLNPVEHAVEQLGPSGLIAVLLTTTVCVIMVVQAIQGKEVTVPQPLINLLSVVFGFYFGKATKSPAQQEPLKKHVGFHQDDNPRT
jgi:hypothetical protein